ncbi:MAG: hypothetical protein BEU04_01285 [Marine Group III euryarchaeote CG-Bathy1]|uniref:Protease PrsW n=1 Tax=Marine Group III euryarchaeote CG-Bathy1 TaxID=1889001 RepID=A0A1J5T6W0_9ARCH|nr:MAG: hypothetical protein BEU04_01285 [Marine Group III euryarchaeote CG-Bathy1]
MFDSYKTIVRIYGLVFGTLLMSMGLQLLFLRYFSENLIEDEDMIIEKIPISLMVVFMLILTCSGLIIVYSLLQPAPKAIKYFHIDSKLDAISKGNKKIEKATELNLPKTKKLWWIFGLSLLIGIICLNVGGMALYIFPICFVIAFSFPSLFWLSYAYRKTNGRGEPERMILVALTWGMISTLPASIMNELVAMQIGADMMKLFEEEVIGMAEIIVITIAAPIMEEILKPLGLILIIKRIKTPYEGILYGVTCGLGFAMIENLLYEIWVVTVFGANEWTVTAFARGMGSTVLHTVGPAIVGFFYAKYHLSNLSGMAKLTLGFLCAFVVHGLWNLVGILPLVKTEWELQSFVILFFFTIACIMIVTKLLNKGLKDVHIENV